LLIFFAVYWDWDPAFRRLLCQRLVHLFVMTCNHRRQR